MKIVICDTYGGFRLSPLAVKYLAELNGKQAYFFITKIVENTIEPQPADIASVENMITWQAFDTQVVSKEELNDNIWYKEHALTSRDVLRNDPQLIEVVEKLGDKVNATCCHLKIVEIPDDVDWEIKEYDGMEWIAEKHRTWK